MERSLSTLYALWRALSTRYAENGVLNQAASEEVRNVPIKQRPKAADVRARAVRFISLEQAMELLGVTHITVMRAAARGEVQAALMPGRVTPVYSLPDLIRRFGQGHEVVDLPA
ncbi:MAG: hypothetical protein ACYDAY_11620 [Candidatus Dormibacteria bacterium]